MSTPVHTVRLVLGDQLNFSHTWFNKLDKGVVYLLCECRSETDYAKHHIQKIVGFFSAMRKFAKQLHAAGHRVHYLRINDTDNKQSVEDNCKYIIDYYHAKHFEYQLPDEYRVDKALQEMSAALNFSYAAVDSEHFLSTRYELKEFFAGKSFLMESFYRYMRKKHQVLMNGTQPEGGVWNLDAENRKNLPKNLPLPDIHLFHHRVAEVIADIKTANIQSIGTVDASDYNWPLTKKDAEVLLNFFCENLLSYFGSYQDAMSTEHWALFHSRLSFALNIKLIHPKEIIDAVVLAWRKQPETISYNQVEGFVRQILGWREYMRGIYWAKMPEYEHLNFFAHKQPLPEWYWTAETKMNCLHRSIKQSLDHAYAHHIQRLMVTGNFALLAGCDPDEVDAWYLGIYIDALQWVEITNTRGMSQYADGGIVGSKPYVSSGAYIKKMSTYCSTCFYNVAKKTGDKACPFNSLYWNFFDQHFNTLAANPRTAMMTQVWKKMNAEEKVALLEQAQTYLAKINEL